MARGVGSYQSCLWACSMAQIYSKSNEALEISPNSAGAIWRYCSLVKALGWPFAMHGISQSRQRSRSAKALSIIVWRVGLAVVGKG